MIIQILYLGYGSNSNLPTLAPLPGSGSGSYGSGSYGSGSYGSGSYGSGSYGSGSYGSGYNNNNLPTLAPLPGGSSSSYGSYGSGYGSGYGNGYNNYPTLVTLATTGASAAATVSTKASACFVEIGANYPVNDLTQLSSPSASDCCNLCGLNSACNAFAYQATTSTCYLKTAAPASGAGNRQSDSTITFGTLTIR